MSSSPSLLPQVRSSGPTNASIMIVGEAPGETEVDRGIPFVGLSGVELTSMLSEAGIDRDLCFITNVARRKPPNNEIENFYIKNTPKNRIAGPVLQAGMDQLYKEISDVRPKIIIALGDTALWALTGNRGITKWRGSQLSYSIEGNGGATAIIIPTYHPAAILRVWSWRAISILDLRRARRTLSEGSKLPKWKFHIRPTYKAVLNFLDKIQQGLDHRVTWIGGDLETRSGHIACFGITTDPNYLEALCIPFMCVEKPEGYFTEEEEIEIVYQLTKLFRHPNSRWIFQNGLYDYQYFARHWGCVPRLGLDTMLTHHVLWAGMPKGLDFLSSMYCNFHRYWKQEGKDWVPSVPEEQLWSYNCLTGDTLILNAYCEWKRLDSIKKGDILLSFEEESSGARYSRKLKGTKVTRTAQKKSRIVKVTFNDGTVLRGTQDHKVFTQRNVKRPEPQWITLNEMRIGYKVYFVGSPWQATDDFKSGYFAGILDGEGTLGVSYQSTNNHFVRPSFSQKKGKVLDASKEILISNGFTIHQSTKTNAEYVDITGGLPEYLRLLGTFPTKRLRTTFWEGACSHGWNGFSALPRLRVVSIEIEPEEDYVYDITTTLGTFIANGIFVHNCKDCVSMMEVAVNLKTVAKELSLTSPVAFQHQQFPAVLDMMLRGVRTNQTSRNELSKELQSYKDKLNSWFTFVLNQEINVDSPKQMMELFYEDLQQKVIRRKRKAGKFTPTMDDDALTLLGQRQPLLLPILKNIARLRSVGKFKSTFVDMQADPIDGRMRTSYGIAGTDTFRYNSARDAFGSGGNLQNIPTGEEEEAAAKTEFPLPNIRKLFIPDEGFTIAEWDLRRADTQVVAWEANDIVLKQMLKEGVNLHNENAKEIFGRYPKNDYDPIYKQAKIGVHAVDYGVMAPTLARELGITLHEADRFIRRWFEIHPGIKNWHDRVWASLQSTRSVTNKFGYRRYYFDRIDSIFPKALAWVPQSTVALVIDKGIVNVFEQLPKVQNLLQVHDSLVNQFPTKDKDFWIREIQPRMLIEIPYEDPLIIPIGVKTSEISWGDCEEYELK